MGKTDASKVKNNASNLKYLDVVMSMIKSNKNEVRTNVFQHCTKLNVQEGLSDIAVLKTATQEVKVKLLHVQMELLKFSKKYNLDFQRNWDKLYGYTLFSHDNAIKKASNQLFLLETSSDDLIEKGIQIFRDDSYIDDLINLLTIQKNSESCEKLFRILNNHVQDTRMGAVIILIINAITDDLARDSTKNDQLVSVMKDVFAHIPLVQSKPNLVYRLINIINIEKFKNDATFRDSFLEAENYILTAFYDSDNYGTAVGLLEILNRIGFDDDKKAQMFETLMEKQSGVIDTKTIVYLLTAAADTFNIFQKVHPNDKFVNFVWLKKCFENDTNPETKSCWITLIVNLLAAYTLTPNIPDMDTNIIQAEASKFHAYLDSEILRQGHTQFTYMNLCTAFCVLNSTFSFNVNTETLKKIFFELDAKSYRFKQRFHVDSRDDGEHDLRLITKFWSSLTTLFARNANLNGVPWSLLEYYAKAEIHLKPYVEDFLLQVLNYGSARYRLFSEAVRDYVTFHKTIPEIKTFLMELFNFVRSSENGCYISAIATQVFLRLINMVWRGWRPATVKSVQSNIFTKCLTQQDRDYVLRVINERLTMTDVDVEKNRYTKFLQHIQSLTIAPADTVNIDLPDTIQSRVTTAANTTQTNEPSATFRRRSTSLAALNLTLSFDN